MLAIGTMQFVSVVMDSIVWLEQLLGLPKGDQDFKQMGGAMGKSGPSFTSWEKMGFNFGKSANSPLENIASNTKDTVKAITTLAKEIKDAGGATAWNMLNGAPAFPSMP
jgi:hypothetical protein